MDGIKFCFTILGVGSMTVATVLTPLLWYLQRKEKERDKQHVNDG